MTCPQNCELLAIVCGLWILWIKSVHSEASCFRSHEDLKLVLYMTLLAHGVPSQLHITVVRTCLCAVLVGVIFALSYVVMLSLWIGLGLDRLCTSMMHCSPCIPSSGFSFWAILWTIFIWHSLMFLFADLLWIISAIYLVSIARFPSVMIDQRLLFIVYNIMNQNAGSDTKEVNTVKSGSVARGLWTLLWS